MTTRVADIQVDVDDVLERLGIEILADRGTWGDALCPFHDEGSPSFSVHLDEGAWICNHGGEKGQLLDLVAKIQGCSRKEAALWIRGLAPKQYTTTDVLVRLFQLSKEAGGDMSATIEWSERYDALDPHLMTEYWFDRGFSAETMFCFDVRYDEKENALIWPVRDEAANLRGFVKRMVPPVAGRRYDYPRGFRRILHPLDHFAGDRVVLVEGPLDALWLHQHGYAGALAVLGSGLTRQQLAWLRRNTTSVTIAFDNDEAGRTGQEKVAHQLADTLTRVAELPNGAKDMQELGAEELKNVLDNARFTFLGGNPVAVSMKVSPNAQNRL